MSTNLVRKIAWSEVPKENVTPTIARQIVTGEKAMAGMITLQKGSHVPKHSHESEQLTYVFEGSLRFLIGGQEILVNAGEVVCFYPFKQPDSTNTMKTFRGAACEVILHKLKNENAVVKIK